jgi:hypothetical protein
MRVGKRKRDKGKGRCQKMRAKDQDGRDEFMGRATKNDAMKEIGKEIRAEKEK